MQGGINVKKWKSMFLIFVLTVSILLPVGNQAQAVDPHVDSDVHYVSDIIYQIMTDRFFDGDPANNPDGDLFSSDGSNLRKYLGGDWQGIIDKINDSYLTNMGITAIWISQPLENVYTVMNDDDGTTSYHGYWARDYKKTNPFFGSMTDFEQLIATAHANDIKVIIDFAPNHTSPALETELNYMENGRLYDNGLYVNGYSDDTNDLFHHNGGTNFSTIEDGVYRNLFDLADFNHQNPFIDQYLKEAIKLWLDKGIDGIRVDAVKHMPFGWQKTFMDTVYDYRPVFTFGEWFLSESEVDTANHYFANESGMSLLDFRFGQKIRQVLRNDTDDWNGFYQMILDTEDAYDEVIDQVTFIDNHDMDRFHYAGANPRRVDQALVVTLTSRGVPNIYYGTEQYMDGNGDPNNRKLMTSFDQNTTAYKVIQKLSPLRQSNSALAYGDTEERWINSDVFIYERQFGNDVVLVAVNRSDSNSYNISGLYTALPKGAYSDVLDGYLNGNSINVNSNGSITPFTLGQGEAAVWEYNTNELTPRIGHIGPMMGQTGHTITISGEGFGSSIGTVKFNAESANIITWNDTQIKAKVPNISSGKYDITVIKAGGTTSNVYDKYEIVSGDQVSVRFMLNNAYTSFGEDVYVVGNIYELGNWNTDKAIGPFFNQVIAQYPTWYYDLNLPEGTTIEFKFIKKDGNGNVTWEGGNNHQFTTPINSPGIVNVNWQN